MRRGRARLNCLESAVSFTRIDSSHFLYSSQKCAPRMPCDPSILLLSRRPPRLGVALHLRSEIVQILQRSHDTDCVGRLKSETKEHSSTSFMELTLTSGFRL
jgi:hypothetical protein